MRFGSIFVATNPSGSDYCLGWLLTQFSSRHGCRLVMPDKLFQRTPELSSELSEWALSVFLSRVFSAKLFTGHGPQQYCNFNQAIKLPNSHKLPLIAHRLSRGELEHYTKVQFNLTVFQFKLLRVNKLPTTFFPESGSCQSNTVGLSYKISHVKFPFIVLWEP